MAHSGYESWVVVYEDSFTDGSPIYPQVLKVNSETLDVGRELRKRNIQISDSRGIGTSSQVTISTKPKGTINFEVHSDDCLKFFYAHFQQGNYSGTTSYAFTPNRNIARYRNYLYDDTEFKPYTISVLKKFFDVYSEGTSNAFLFQNGVVDSLTLNLATGQEMALEASIRFLGVDAAYTTQNAPTGSYSPHRAFESWSANVAMNGQSIDLFGLSLTSTNKLQESLTLGTDTPIAFKFLDYEMKGALSFDLPTSALDQIGSMFGTRTFSLTATLTENATSYIAISLPTCRRLSFNYALNSGALQSQMPFEAYNDPSNPITFTVRTDYDFTPLTSVGTIIDAHYGIRGTTSFWIDAQLGTRGIASIIYDRDL